MNLRIDEKIKTSECVLNALNMTFTYPVDRYTQAN